MYELSCTIRWQIENRAPTLLCIILVNLLSYLGRRKANENLKNDVHCLSIMSIRLSERLETLASRRHLIMDHHVNKGYRDKTFSAMIAGSRCERVRVSLMLLLFLIAEVHCGKILQRLAVVLIIMSYTFSCHLGQDWQMISTNFGWNILKKTNKVMRGESKHDRKHKKRSERREREMGGGGYNGSGPHRSDSVFRFKIW